MQRAAQAAAGAERGTAEPAQARRSQRTLATGTVLENRYEVQRICGRGGMSTVYAARDLRFSQVERICAIKEMFDLDPDSNVRALRMINFEREAALLATISHPAVPKIYDFFSHGGLVYLVLEFIEGQDLERLLDKRRSPFAEDQLRRWASEICAVLATLHAHKPDPIIFRDLKPSNIMLRTTGQIALVDFGIARTIQGRQRGTMIGTEGYAPPEQYRGIADGRGDIYALGATLHHLATNIDPRHETPFTFQERPVRSVNPDIGEPFSAIIMKMLAYNPVDRYQSISAVQADLEALDGRAVVTRPATMTTLLTTSPSPTQSTAPAVEVPIPEPVPAVPVAVAAPELERPLERRTQAPARKRASRRKRVDFDAITDRLVWAAQTGDEVRGSAAFDGRSFFIGSYDHHVYSVTPTDGAIRWRFRTSRGVVSRPAVAGDLVVFGSEDHSVYAVGVDSGLASWSYRTGMPVRSSPAVVGSRVIVGSDDGSIYCLDVADGKLAWKTRTWGPVRSSPTVSGTTVYVGSDDGYLYAIDVDSGRVQWRASCSGAVQSTPWVGDTMIYVTGRSGSAIAFAIRNGERVWQHDDRATLIASPRMAGDLLVFGTADGALLGIASSDGAQRWSSRFANQITSSALLAGNFGYVGTVDGDCVCFSVSSGEMIWRYTVGGNIVSNPVYGGGVLLVGSTDGRICGLALTDIEIEVLQRLQEGSNANADTGAHSRP